MEYPPYFMSTEYPSNGILSRILPASSTIQPSIKPKIRSDKRTHMHLEQERSSIPIKISTGIEKKKEKKKKGFDISKIVDANVPFTQYAKLDQERKSKLFARLVCIPPQFLTRGLCRKAIALADLLGKKLSAKFLAKAEELEKAKEERIRLYKEKRRMAGRGAVDASYQQPSTSFSSNIEPEYYIEPLHGYMEETQSRSYSRSQSNSPYRSFPPSRSPSRSPSTGPSNRNRSEGLSSKINSLYSKFCAPQIRNTVERSRKNPSGNDEIIRVPSPVDLSRSPWKSQRREEEVPLEEIVRTDAYSLEEPLIKLTKRVRFPITVQEIETVMDMVLLCQLRDAPSVMKPFIHSTTHPFLKKISEKLGKGFELKEITKSTPIHAPKGYKPADRITTSVWFQGITKLLTLGEGAETNAQTAASFAHASCMAALVYMLVIPFQLVLMVQKAGEEFIPLAVHACKQRIKELIAVSRDPYYGQLLLHETDLNSCNEDTKEIWSNFINRMRHMGMAYWENKEIKVPEYWKPFPSKVVPDFYFECVQDKSSFSWEGMVPNSYDIIPFDIEDFLSTFSVSRFSCSPAEAGLIKLESNSTVNRSIMYQLKHHIPHVPSSKYDPIVHLPFRDLLFHYGATVLKPMFTLFTVKYIGHRWGRRLVIKHQLVIDVDLESKETWKHVVRLSFDGIPYFFLGAKCAKETFTSALAHCCSIIAQQLSTMMIIPRELCNLLEKSSSIVAAVIYGCRLRFQAFEALMRNPMFASLIVLENAELQFKNPLYKLAENFYWRMRNSGWEYWMENRLIRVPMGLIKIKHLPSNTFFQFQECFDAADWTQINSPANTYDNFDVNCLMPEDRFPAHWEDGGSFDNNPTNNEDIGHSASNPNPDDSRDFETALINEYKTPLCLLSAKECEAMLNIIRSLAGMGFTVLQMNITNELAANNQMIYHCEMSWAGDLSWILNARYADEKEANLQYGAAWILYKLLIKMRMVPPGLYKFVSNNESRLPYVISSLAPFFNLLESIFPSYRRMGDEQSAKSYLINEMHHLAVKEWQNRSIVLPPQMLPSLQETEEMPFIKTETMGFQEYEEWNRKFSMYQKKAEILDSRGHQITQKPLSDPDMKMGKRKFNKVTESDPFVNSIEEERNALRALMKDAEAHFAPSTSTSQHYFTAGSKQPDYSVQYYSRNESY